MLGPAIFSGKWDLMYLYWFAQFFGASCAALMVQFSFRIGLKAPKQDARSALDVMSQIHNNMSSPAALNDFEKGN